jgi:hypothetical protein
MIKIGTIEASNIKIGETQVQKMYLGTNLIWQYSSGGGNNEPTYTEQYFTLEAAADSCDITIKIPAQVTTTNYSYLEYSTDNGTTWTRTNNADSLVTINIPTLDTGEKVLLRGSGDRISVGTTYNGANYYSNITATQNFKAYGNTMSLLYGSSFSDKVAFPSSVAAIFGALFYNSTHLVDAKNLILPATTLVATDCYNDMFRNTRITESPILPALTLVESCYKRMFQDCTALTKITILATSVTAKNCLQDWVKNISTTGVMYKNSSASWTGYIPSNWTTAIAS